MALRVSNLAPYCEIRDNAIKKWKSYHSDYFQEGAEYLLLFEDGQCAQFLPGTTEFLTLKKYKEEIGKDYKGIVLYLCSEEDYNLANGFCKNDDDDDNFKPSKKRTRQCIETSTSTATLVLENHSKELQIEKPSTSKVGVHNGQDSNNSGTLHMNLSVPNVL